MEDKDREKILNILKSKAEVCNQPDMIRKIALAYTVHQSQLLFCEGNSISLCKNSSLIITAIIMSISKGSSSLTILTNNQEGNLIEDLDLEPGLQKKLNYLFSSIDNLVQHKDWENENYSSILLSVDQLKYVPELILNKFISSNTILIVDKSINNEINDFAVMNDEGFKELFSSEELAIFTPKKSFEDQEDYFDYYSKVLQNTYNNCLNILADKRLRVTVGIVAYNIENYIEECLQSVVDQKGDFDLDVIISEDCSTDSTKKRIEDFINNTDIPHNCSIHYIENHKNFGLVKNYQSVISKASEIKNDYFILLDGDDYFLSTNRIQTHLNFMENHPEFAMSFDSVLLYSEKTKRFYLDEEKQNLDKKVFTLFDLLDHNFMGAYSMIRGNLLSSIPDSLFSIFSADWFIHLWIAQFGLIGFINKPMFVYRQHPGGDWSGRKRIVNYQRLYQAINDLGRISNYKYMKYMNSFQNRLIETGFDEPFFDLDLLIIDDVFPHPANGYRLQEFENYMDVFPRMKIFSNGVWSHLLGKKSNDSIISNYKITHPEYADNIINWDKGYKINCNISAKVAYIVFLGNAFPALDFLERNDIPFILELYPGGSFGLNNSQSDSMLRRVLKSPCFRKVVVTQDATRDYLLEKGYCDESDILFVFGVVVPERKLKGLGKPKIHYGQGKQHLDICFVGMKYTEFGVDKGYDIFIGLAKKICRKYKNIFFHVVGGFDSKTLDIEDITDRITFYGHQDQEWFEDFYVDKDVIISPNLNGLTHNGAFDGFPVAACTDAGLYETAILCCDPLGLNNGRFRNHVDIEILDRNIDAYVKMVEYYINAPEKLIELSIKGMNKIKELYNIEVQMKPRINLIENEIFNWPYFKTMIVQKKFAKEPSPSDNIDNPISNKSKITDLFQYIRILRDAILVKNSGLFDRAWYLQENPDVKRAHVNPLIHYLKYGWREGRSPSRVFDQKRYLEVYADVKVSGLNPLVHYIKFGRSEGRVFYPVIK